jgi:hypothetical protein
MKLFLSMVLTTGLLLTIGHAANAQGKKIGMKRAQAIALEHSRGLKLKGKELEHENGKWIYSFEFKNYDGSTREVNVDAYSGKIVGIEREPASREKKESKDQKRSQ